MKRGNVVLSKKEYVAGRRLARWAKGGMNWDEGPGKTLVQSQGRTVLTNPSMSVNLTRVHDKLLAELGTSHATQASVSAALQAVVTGDDSWMMDLAHMAYSARRG